MQVGPATRTEQQQKLPLAQCQTLANHTRPPESNPVLCCGANSSRMGHVWHRRFHDENSRLAERWPHLVPPGRSSLRLNCSPGKESLEQR
jgi:hypothetical protein